MKEIQLTQGKVALVDDEDYEYLNQWKWHTHNNITTFYARRNIWIGVKRTSIKIHQVITGGKETDHIDHNGLNCQKHNLRICSRSQNTMNRSPNKNTSSKYKGVCWDRYSNKWRAQIQINRVKKHIGMFVTETDAAEAYNKKAKELFEEFAFINKT